MLAAPAVATSQVEGFPPVVGDRLLVLILGTVPGQRSLADGRYYADPRNAFWRVLEPWGAGPEVAYPDRCRALLAAGLGLWDVLAGCDREGSLDQAIRAPRPNDFGPLFAAHREMRVVLLNGEKARGLFDRFVAPPAGVEVWTLPSTSSANSRRGKVEIWRETLAAFVEARR